MKVYIISYLPDEPNLRAKRLQYHIKQLNWFKSWGNNYITVLAQNYQQSDYQNQLVDEYIVSEKIRPGPARNILLDKFYCTNDDFAIFCDDDAVLYDTPNNEKYSDLSFLSPDIDLFYPINVRDEPISEQKHKANVYDFHVFKKNWNLKGSLFYIKNFKKYYGQKIYFNLDYNIGEDIELAFRLLSQNYGVYKCINLALKEFATSDNTSTLDERKTQELRNQQHEIFKKKIERDYDIKFENKSEILNKNTRRKTVKIAKQDSLYANLFVDSCL